jgi:hypothetical protein
MIRPLAKIKNLHYSGDRIQETGDRIQEIIFIYSPHFPTPHTPHPTPHTLCKELREED